MSALVSVQWATPRPSPAPATGIPEMISRTEAAARAAGVSVGDLCKSAGINRATWQRWKAGTVSPTFRKWQQVETAVRAAANAAPAAEPEDFSGEAAA